MLNKSMDATHAFPIAEQEPRPTTMRDASKPLCFFRSSLRNSNLQDFQDWIGFRVYVKVELCYFWAWVLGAIRGKHTAGQLSVAPILTLTQPKKPPPVIMILSEQTSV